MACKVIAPFPPQLNQSGVTFLSLVILPFISVIFCCSCTRRCLRNKLYVTFTYELFIFAIVVFFSLSSVDFVTLFLVLITGKFHDFFKLYFFVFDDSMCGSGFVVIGSEQKQSTAVPGKPTNPIDQWEYNEHPVDIDKHIGRGKQDGDMETSEQ